MKLRHEIVIRADRDTVWMLFTTNDRRPDWQPWIASADSVSGSPAAIGHVRRITTRGKPGETLESITEMRRPDFIAVIEESAGHKALVVDNFESVDESATRWTRWSNRSFRGLRRFTAVFEVAGSKERMVDDMNRFKLLVETEAAENRQ